MYINVLLYIDWVGSRAVQGCPLVPIYHVLKQLVCWLQCRQLILTGDSTRVAGAHCSGNKSAWMYNDDAVEKDISKCKLSEVSDVTSSAKSGDVRDADYWRRLAFSPLRFRSADPIRHPRASPWSSRESAVTRELLYTRYHEVSVR